LTTTAPVSECRQSFAQARILELLEFRDAERALGDELFVGTRKRKLSSTSSFEEQAQELALDAGLVWPGLTAMVTVESDTCTTEASEVCFDGEGTDGDSTGSESDTSAPGGATSAPVGSNGQGGVYPVSSPTDQDSDYDETSAGGHRGLSACSLLVSGLLAGVWFLACAS
jgi:hypothetical protein